MADDVVGVRQAAVPDKHIDNETAANASAPGGVATRQRVAAAGIGGAALATDTSVGSLTEAAPATDTASAGLNGRLQRVAQRLSSIIGLLPGSLGQKARAASLAVTLSTEDVAALTPPGTQVVSAVDFDVRNLTLAQDSVHQSPRKMTPLSVSKTGPLTDDVLVAVSAGQRIRLLRNAGHCNPATAAGVYPVVTVKIGATTVYSDKLEAGLPWAELVCFEGADGEDLTLTLTLTETVFLNMRYEVFTP